MVTVLLRESLKEYSGKAGHKLLVTCRDTQVGTEKKKRKTSRAEGSHFLGLSLSREGVGWGLFSKWLFSERSLRFKNVGL